MMMIWMFLLVMAPPAGLEVMIGGATKRFDMAALEGLDALDQPSADGRDKFRAVSVEAVVRAAGLTNGPFGKDAAPRDKHHELSNVIVAAARDGYQSVFSFAELADKHGATKAWLVWQRNGKALSEEEGPFRLLVPSDHNGSRAIHQLVRLNVIDMRTIVKPCETH